MKTYGFTELSEIPVLLLPLYEDKKVPSELSWLESWLQNLELKAGKVYHVLTGKQPGTILLLGLGKPEEISYSKLGKYVGQAVRSLKQEVCLCCDTVSGQNLEFEKAVYEMAFACTLSSYEFTKIGEDTRPPGYLFPILPGGTPNLPGCISYGLLCKPRPGFRKYSQQLYDSRGLG